MKVKYGNTVASVKPAQGVSGVLCKSANGDFFFRIELPDGKFEDFYLRHDDLPITISADALASFYELPEESLLDHSPSVLGLEEVND